MLIKQNSLFFPTATHQRFSRDQPIPHRFQRCSGLFQYPQPCAIPAWQALLLASPLSLPARSGSEAICRSRAPILASRSSTLRSRLLTWPASAVASKNSILHQNGKRHARAVVTAATVKKTPTNGYCSQGSLALLTCSWQKSKKS